MDPSPDKKDIFGPDTVLLSDRAPRFIATATRDIILSPTHASAILHRIAQRYVKTFMHQEVSLLEKY